MTDVVAALVASEVGASLPIPTLMGFGAYEAGGAAALGLLGYPLALALLVLLTVHIVSQILDYAIGGICLVVFFLISPGRRDRRRSENASVSAPSHGRWSYIGAAALTLVLAGGLLVYQLARRLGCLEFKPVWQSRHPQDASSGSAYQPADGSSPYRNIPANLS